MSRAKEGLHLPALAKSIYFFEEASLPSLELKIVVRAERPCARDASICRILQGDRDEVSNT